MILKISLLFFAIVALFVESTLIPFPFVFIILAVYFAFMKDIFYFIFAFLSAILLDVLTFHTIGSTPLFLSLFFLSLFLLQRIQSEFDMRLYMGIVFVFSLFYMFYIGYSFELVPIIFSFFTLMILGFSLFRLQQK